MNSKNRFVGFIKSIGYDLKKHQINGFKWCYNKEHSGGGLLCDEMGLGKTILMLSCIKLNPKFKTLIVLPKSLLNQWIQKIRSILQIEPFVYHSSGNIKRGNTDEYYIRIINSVSVVITTYGMISKRKFNNININCKLWNIKWDRIIYDEAHNMRNKNCVYYGAKQLKGDIKWLMTGTPIQNSWNDIISLCLLLDISELTNGIKKGKDINIKIAFIKKYMLHRTKKEVNIKMPKLNITNHKIPFHNDEKKISQDIHYLLKTNKTVVGELNPLIEYIESKGIFAYMCRAKQCCIYPTLLKNCIIDKDVKNIEKLPRFDYLDNSKIDYLINLIKSKDITKKKIIFCYFTKEAEKIKMELNCNNYIVGVINGNTTEKMRKILFNHNKIDVLIIQIQCGCDGLNLQKYQQMYFTSPHWNPAIEQQAIGRIYRIGQMAEEIEVHHLISTFNSDDDKTLDEYCLKIQNIKKKIINMLFNDNISIKKKKLNIKKKIDI